MKTFLEHTLAEAEKDHTETRHHKQLTSLGYKMNLRVGGAVPTHHYQNAAGDRVHVSDPLGRHPKLSQTKNGAIVSSPTTLGKII